MKKIIERPTKSGDTHVLIGKFKGNKHFSIMFVNKDFESVKRVLETHKEQLEQHKFGMLNAETGRLRNEGDPE